MKYCRRFSSNRSDLRGRGRHCWIALVVVGTIVFLTAGSPVETTAPRLTLDGASAGVDSCSASGHAHGAPRDLASGSSPESGTPVIRAVHEVRRTGTSGSADISVTGNACGPLPIGVFGLNKGVRLASRQERCDGHSACAAQHERRVWEIAVPARTPLVAFNLDSAAKGGDGTDIDLAVFRLTGPGGLIAEGWESTGAGTSEGIALVAPPAATYRVVATVHKIAAPATSVVFDVTTSIVDSDSREGTLAVSPSTVQLGSTQSERLTVSWTGLEANSRYVGLVAYGESGHHTIIAIDTRPPPSKKSPPIRARSGNPTHHDP